MTSMEYPLIDPEIFLRLGRKMMLAIPEGWETSDPAGFIERHNAFICGMETIPDAGDEEDEFDGD